MSYIVLSVLCSVTVSVLLKLAPRWHVDARQAIAGSYLVASLLSLGLFHSSFDLLTRAPDDPAWPILLLLGVLLPSIFLAMARSVECVGVVRTDAAQRLSLLLPLIAAFTLFGESLTWQKAIGVLLGLAAIVCIVARRDESGTAGRGGYYWLILVFAGLGINDILFKRMAQLTNVAFTEVLLAAFVLAFALSVVYVVVLYLRGRMSWRWRHAGVALLLGLFNFGNIFFYVQAHRRLSHDPALVFSAMNIGVIVLAAIIGGWVFREPLGRFNWVGLVLAIAAVSVLASAY